MNNKKEILIIFLLLIFSYPAVKSLLIPGAYTSHDLTHHVIRQINMDKLLSEGQFPLRWSADLNNGYGYPLFLFNYPLPALVGEVFHKLGFNFVDSVKAVLFLSMLVSILGMYLFLKELLGSRLAAFLGAIFYLYAPIRFLNVYVSAATGSALALALIPFVFWAILRRSILVGSISLAALILSHNVTALIFIPVIIIFSVVCSRLRSLAVMLLLGLGLSAWFWLPALWEKQFIKFDQIYEGFYKDQFINIWQLIRSPWGYGLSHPQHPEPGDMSYQLGLIHIGVVIVTSLWFVVFGRKIKEVKAVGGFLLTFILLSLFLMLKISQPVWEIIPILKLVQFPLRFQAIFIFAASISAGLLIKYFPYKQSLRTNALRKIVFLGLLILVIYANRNHWKINEVFNPGEDYYLSQKTTTTSYGEHMPKWGKTMNKSALSKLEFVEGKGNINILENKSAKVLAQVESITSSKLRFNQFYFPGWQIKVDNKKIDFNYLIEGESYGLPVFNIDAGKHKIEASFKNVTDRNIADTISLISIVAAGLLMLNLW